MPVQPCYVARGFVLQDEGSKQERGASQRPAPGRGACRRASSHGGNGHRKSRGQRPADPCRLAGPRKTASGRRLPRSADPPDRAASPLLQMSPKKMPVITPPPAASSSAASAGPAAERSTKRQSVHDRLNTRVARNSQPRFQERPQAPRVIRATVSSIRPTNPIERGASTRTAGHDRWRLVATGPGQYDDDQRIAQHKLGFPNVRRRRLDRTCPGQLGRLDQRANRYPPATARRPAAGMPVGTGILQRCPARST